MSVIAIIQARMSSKRLPGKVLLPLAGVPALNHVVTRVQSCKTIDKVVVATSTDTSDDSIEMYCKEVNFDFYRGNLLDVLDRYYQCAKSANASTIVRITADCPVIDPIVVDAVVTGFLAGRYDYYSLSGEFPDGLDCAVITFQALEKAWKYATLPSDREHVGPYIYSTAKELFKVGGFEIFNQLSNVRLTLDEPADFKLLTLIFENLYQREKIFLINDILRLLSKNPLWLNINSSIMRNEGYEISLSKDKLI
jgi:spore coat polysaccharide biosynthesis protein SpsF